MTPLSPQYQKGLVSYHRRNTHIQIESSYTVEISFIIPPSLPTGTYNVSVRTDYRNQVFELSYETNNLRWMLITIREKYCDLVITNTSYRVESSIRGNLLRYSYTVQNNGGGPTIGAPWFDKLTISSTYDFNNRNVMTLQSLRYSSDLPVHRSYQNNIVTYLPQYRHGTVYLRLSIDDKHQIVEEDEGNNVGRSGAITVVPLYADLAAQSLSILTGGRIFGGQDIELQWSVINQGESLVQHLWWYDTVSLGATRNLDDGTKLADVIVSNGNNFMFEPQTTYQQRRTVTLPLDLDYSLMYRIILQVNSRGQISENGRLNNNLRDVVIPILPPPSPDLHVIQLSYTYFPLSRVLTVQWEVHNVGNTMTRTMNWQDQVFISSRLTFNPATSEILGQRDQSLRMSANQVYTLRDSYFVSSALFGRFYIYVVTDVSNSVMEIDGEDNNVRRSEATFLVVEVPTITLNISINLDSLPSDYFTGQTFTVEFSVLNSGDVAVGTSSWVDSIYLSNVAYPSRTYLLSDGFLLAEKLNTMQLNQDDTYTVMLNVTLPHNALGQRFLTVLLDTNNHLDIRTIGISGTIINIEQGPLPDLTVSAISSNLNITSGQPATIDYSVSNRGELEATGLWYEALILSIDAEIDPFDTRLITVRNPPIGLLRVNESYNQSVEVFIPYDLPTSFYYIFIIVDTRNDLHEEEMDNNRDNFVLFITETVNTDIAVLNIQVSPANLTYGEMMAYRYTLRNNGSLQAGGYKCDSLYISADNTWDITDFEIGVPQCGAVTLNGFGSNVRNDRTYSRAAVVPFIAHGSYYGLVRTRTNIRDPNLSNNIGTTSNFIQINAPIIILGRRTRITLEPNNILVFQIQGVPGGEALVANLTTGQLHVYHDLYLRYKEAPTGAEHDAFSQFSLSANQHAVVRHSISGTYYLRIESFTNTQITSSYSVDILVRIAQFEIHRVSPVTAAPIGNVTLKITGTVISYFSYALLIDSSGNVILEPSKMYWFNSETVYATFNITEIAVGIYSVRLIDEKTGSTAQLNNSFTIATGIPGRLAINIQTPRALRVGDTGDIMVRLQNIGNTDLLAPHLILVSRDRTHFRLIDESGPIDFSEQLDFLGLPLEGPGGILPPGATTQITFRAAQTIQGANRTRICIKVQNNSAPHPFVDKKSNLKPAAVPADVWDKIWENFIRSVGTTHGSFLERLSEMASEFSLVGKRTYSVQEMVLYQLRISYGLLSGTYECYNNCILCIT